VVLRVTRVERSRSRQWAVLSANSICYSLCGLEVADRNIGKGNIEIHQQYVPLLHPVGRGDAVGVIGRPLDQLDPVAVGINDPCRSEVV
jgi:hypothetical protein